MPENDQSYMSQADLWQDLEAIKKIRTFMIQSIIDASSILANDSGDDPSTHGYIWTKTDRPKLEAMELLPLFKEYAEVCSVAETSVMTLIK